MASLTLTTPKDISGSITELKVSQFAFNLDEDIVYIGFDAYDADSKLLRDNVPFKVSGAEYTTFVARFNELATTLSGTAALLQTCLEQLPFDGTVT